LHYLRVGAHLEQVGRIAGQGPAKGQPGRIQHRERVEIGGKHKWRMKVNSRAQTHDPARKPIPQSICQLFESCQILTDGDLQQGRYTAFPAPCRHLY
jgi:hypothetical protein